MIVCFLICFCLGIQYEKILWFWSRSSVEWLRLISHGLPQLCRTRDSTEARPRLHRRARSSAPFTRLSGPFFGWSGGNWCAWSGRWSCWSPPGPSWYCCSPWRSWPDGASTFSSVPACATRTPASGGSIPGDAVWLAASSSETAATTKNLTPPPVSMVLIMLQKGLTFEEIKTLVLERMVLAKDDSDTVMYPRFMQKVVDVAGCFAWVYDGEFDARLVSYTTKSRNKPIKTMQSINQSVEVCSVLHNKKAEINPSKPCNQSINQWKCAVSYTTKSQNKLIKPCNQSINQSINQWNYVLESMCVMHDPCQKCVSPSRFYSVDVTNKRLDVWWQDFF